MNIKKRIGKIFLGLAIIAVDIFIYIVLGFLLMQYEDFFDDSKGEYYSLASMNLTEKTIYICYNIWIVLNIIGFIYILVYIGKNIYKRTKQDSLNF